MTRMLPRYDIHRSYDWNYEHAPECAALEVPAMEGNWSFCGRPVASPLGMPAGPLLNGRWCLYYAGLGFDVLTYKTVRSREHGCYSLPNLQPVNVMSIQGGEAALPSSAKMQGSWAVSFGMPSKSPEVWRADIERTRARLPAGKLLSVSVVGTVQLGWTIDDLAADYARCARWAVESGADCVEANFSCPNVASRDGQLYQQPVAAQTVAAFLREAARRVPLLIKIGHVPDASTAGELVEALAPFVDALAMTNCIAARVKRPDGTLLFRGEPRGIGGSAILDTSLQQVRIFSKVIGSQGAALQLVGVGGAASAEDVRRYLRAGAQAVHIATAAMRDPLTAVQIRREWAEAQNEPSGESGRR